MRKEACIASGGIYRPRHPRVSPLHHCVRCHYDELEAGGHFTRPVEEQVLTRFLDCGDLHRGFARIHCDDCGHDYLLAFSCKARYFCPSCHQKRMMAYGEWVEENVLAPVPHRQYVFALPKLLRPYFRQHRKHLGALCRIVAKLLSRHFIQISVLRPSCHQKRMLAYGEWVEDNVLAPVYRAVSHRISGVLGKRAKDHPHPYYLPHRRYPRAPIVRIGG